jgi:error-prone DNA polymerase
VQDAQRHGIEVRPPDVAHSTWDCTLEPASGLAGKAKAGTAGAEQGLARLAQPAVRLGLRLLSGLSRDVAKRIAQARTLQPFAGVDDLARRAGLSQADMRQLASGDALMSLAGHRRQQVWEASALHQAPALLRDAPVHEDLLTLPAAHEGEEVVFDYAALGLTLRSHPLALLRPALKAERLWTAQQMNDFPNGRLARACGIVTGRQQPGTASGVVFVTLEDETGNVNVVVWSHVRERFRQELLRARLLAVYGVWQREGEVRHLIAQHLRDLTPWLGQLPTQSRDFK